MHPLQNCEGRFERNRFLGSVGSIVARLELKVIDGRAPPGVEHAAYFDSTREILPVPDIKMIDSCASLIRFIGWWCMAVLSWWVTLSG